MSKLSEALERVQVLESDKLILTRRMKNLEQDRLNLSNWERMSSKGNFNGVYRSVIETCSMPNLKYRLEFVAAV